MGFIVHDKTIKVHNSLVGHSGLERCLKRLADSKQSWKYMREHVRAFIRACPCCQKMSVLKTPIHGHPFTTSTYEPMVRLNIDFVGSFSDGGYILTIIDTFTRWLNCTYAKVLMQQKPLAVYSNTSADSELPHRYFLIEVLTS